MELLLQLARNAASEILTKILCSFHPKTKLLEKQLEHRRKETANWVLLAKITKINILFLEKFCFLNKKTLFCEPKAQNLWREHFYM